MNEIKTQANPDVKIFLIGNKSDLEAKRKVTKDEADKYCQENQLDLNMETSAKTGFNARAVFIEAAKCLYNEHLKYRDRASKVNVPGASTPKGMKLPQPTRLAKTKTEEEVQPKKGGCC